MSENKWTAYDTIQTVLDTGLNTLGNGNHALSGELDFTGSPYNSHIYFDVEFVLASVDLSAQVNPAIYLWVLRCVDGTNYEDGSAGTPGVNPARQADIIIPLRAVNAAQRPSGVLGITTPGKGKILLKNAAGAAFASANNTLKIRTYSSSAV